MGYSFHFTCQRKTSGFVVSFPLFFTGWGKSHQNWGISSDIWSPLIANQVTCFIQQAHVKSHRLIIIADTSHVQLPTAMTFQSLCYLRPLLALLYSRVMLCFCSALILVGSALVCSALVCSVLVCSVFGRLCFGRLCFGLLYLIGFLLCFNLFCSILLQCPALFFSSLYFYFIFLASEIQFMHLRMCIYVST